MLAVLLGKRTEPNRGFYGPNPSKSVSHYRIPILSLQRRYVAQALYFHLWNSVVTPWKLHRLQLTVGDPPADC